MKNVCLIVFQNFTKIHQNFNEKWKKSAKNLLYKLGYLRIYKNVILKTSCSRFLFGYKVQSIYWNLRSYVNMLYSKDVILADFHFSFLAHFLLFLIKCLIKIILFFLHFRKSISWVRDFRYNFVVILILKCLCKCN